ncbi:MAG: hypothetical protein AAB448_00315, partial [Patescibacteria group bacterium]
AAQNAERKEDLLWGRGDRLREKIVLLEETTVILQERARVLEDGMRLLEETKMLLQERTGLLEEQGELLGARLDVCQAELVHTLEAAVEPPECEEELELLLTELRLCEEEPPPPPPPPP